MCKMCWSWCLFAISAEPPIPERGPPLTSSIELRYIPLCVDLCHWINDYTGVSMEVNQFWTVRMFCSYLWEMVGRYPSNRCMPSGVRVQDGLDVVYQYQSHWMVIATGTISIHMVLFYDVDIIYTELNDVTDHWSVKDVNEWRQWMASIYITIYYNSCIIGIFWPIYSCVFTKIIF